MSAHLRPVGAGPPDEEAPPEETGGAEALDQANDQDAHLELTPRPCRLCCPPTGHHTDEVPFWLQDDPECPAHWRLIHAVIRPLHDSVWVGMTREEKICCARMFAHTYGDRALVRALRTALDPSWSAPHDRKLDPYWTRLLAEFHKRGVR